MLTFVGQAVRNFYHVGAVWPSSPLLAKALVRPMLEMDPPRRILEVGAGTGAITKAILPLLRDGDHLAIVELNPVFCASLEELAARRRREVPGATIEVHAKPIEEAPLKGPFDFVICGLPFNNFPPALMRRIFRRMLSLLAEEGSLTYFQYAWVRGVRSRIASLETRRRLRRIEAVGRSLHRRLEGERELILGNFPPAVAVRLRRRGALPRNLVDSSLVAEPLPRTARAMVASR